MTTGSVTYHHTPQVRATDLRDLFAAAWPRGAVDFARHRGVTWLHADYTSDLEPFYRACGFRPTTAGLMDLSGRR